MTVVTLVWTAIQSNSVSNLSLPHFSYLLFTLPTQITVLFQTVSWEAIYLLVTLIIGGLIAYEAVTLKKNEGKLPTNFLFNISSILETLWMIVTGAILYFGNLSLYPKVIAVAYILYAMFGWAYSFYLLQDQDFDIEMEDIDNIAMPAKYIDYSLSFSWVIMVACLGFLFILFNQGKFHLNF